jgi:hypothetical protein
MQLTSFVISVLVLVVFLTICIVCKVKSSRKKKTNKYGKKSSSNGKIGQANSSAGNHHMGQTGSQVNGNGTAIYYKYSPANSMDYLGIHFQKSSFFISFV